MHARVLTVGGRGRGRGRGADAGVMNDNAGPPKHYPSPSSPTSDFPCLSTW